MISGAPISAFPISGAYPLVVPAVVVPDDFTTAKRYTFPPQENEFAFPAQESDFAFPPQESEFVFPPEL